jgi:hypothetical protein
MVVREGKMVAGVEPAVVGMAEAVEFADVDHGRDLGGFTVASSVSDVTVGPGAIRFPIALPRRADAATALLTNSSQATHDAHASLRQVVRTKAGERM